MVRWLLILACFFSQASLLAQTGGDARHRFPDVPDAWLEAAQYKNEHFSMAVLFGGLLDYTILDQDQQSIDQIGKQDGV